MKINKSNPYRTPISRNILQPSPANQAAVIDLLPFALGAAVPVILMGQYLMLYWAGDADPFFREVSQQSASLALGIYAAIFLLWLLWAAVLLFAVARGWFAKWSVVFLICAILGGELVRLVVATHLGE